MKPPGLSLRAFATPRGGSCGGPAEPDPRKATAQRRDTQKAAVPPGVPTRQPMHPGRLLDHAVLRPLSLTQGQAAQRLGISRRRVNELVQGQRGMSADTAIRCALAFGIDAGFWLGLQARWDSYQHWLSLRRQA